MTAIRISVFSHLSPKFIPHLIYPPLSVFSSRSLVPVLYFYPTSLFFSKFLRIFAFHILLEARRVSVFSRARHCYFSHRMLLLNVTSFLNFFGYTRLFFLLILLLISIAKHTASYNTRTTRSL